MLQLTPTILILGNVLNKSPSLTRKVECNAFLRVLTSRMLQKK